MALYVDNKTFVIHIAAPAEPTVILIYLSCKAQVDWLISIEISTKYFNFSDVFSLDFVVKLLDHIRMNDYLINLLKDKQPPYSPIYSLELVELKILKIYIKDKLASNFIRPFKSSTGAPILFEKKKDGSLRLYINYREFNNLLIKNCYLLPLISKLFNCLSCTKHFIRLNLTNAYYQMRIQKNYK